MIYFNQHKSWKSVHFNGHNIIGVYNSLGKVWPESVETIYRWVKTDETTCVEDEPTIIFRYVKTDVTTCVEDN